MDATPERKIMYFDCSAEWTDRLGALDGEDRFSPTSLVGSYFHSDKDTGRMRGVVVAEPSPGVYLVEVVSWVDGSHMYQKLVKLDDMFDWQFYDVPDWFNKWSEKFAKEEFGHE